MVVAFSRPGSLVLNETGLRLILSSSWLSTAVTKTGNSHSLGKLTFGDFRRSYIWSSRLVPSTAQRNYLGKGGLLRSCSLRSFFLWLEVVRCRVSLWYTSGHVWWRDNIHEPTFEWSLWLWCYFLASHGLDLIFVRQWLSIVSWRNYSGCWRGWMGIVISLPDLCGPRHGGLRSWWDSIVALSTIHVGLRHWVWCQKFSHLLVVDRSLYCSAELRLEDIICFGSSAWLIRPLAVARTSSNWRWFVLRQCVVVWFDACRNLVFRWWVGVDGVILHSGIGTSCCAQFPHCERLIHVKEGFTLLSSFSLFTWHRWRVVTGPVVFLRQMALIINLQRWVWCLSCC